MNIGQNAPVAAGRAAVRELVNAAKVAAPVDTGFLRSSIKEGNISPTSAEAVAEAEYAGFVEYGTSKMAAQPYMEPAIPRAIQLYTSTIINELFK